MCLKVNSWVKCEFMNKKLNSFVKSRFIGIHFCTHEFMKKEVNSFVKKWIHWNSLLYTWIHFFTHEFIFLHMNSLFYTWIHFFTHEFTFKKKMISFWNSLFHLRMIWLVWHTYRFFFQINFILKFTFSSSNDLISVTYRHTYIQEVAP